MSRSERFALGLILSFAASVYLRGSDIDGALDAALTFFAAAIGYVLSMYLTLSAVWRK